MLKKLTIITIALAVLVGCKSTQPEQSLYEEIGGSKTLNTVFGVAINRIYNDPVIGHYFNGVPKKHLREQLVSQTCELIGGPCVYEGKSMLESHQGLNIKESEFNILVEYVQGAMRDVGLTYAQENQILNKLAPVRYETIYL